MELVASLPDVSLHETTPWLRIGLHNLIRELDMANNDTYRDGLMSPLHSTCTSLGEEDVVLVWILDECSTKFCTCGHKDAKISFGLESNKDILIYCSS